MYNIKQAAARAGVTVPVLRAWERRYGIVSPDRTASGYRRFDDEAIARVRAMRGLVDEGWSPSAAAAALIAGTAPMAGAVRPSAVRPSAVPTPDDAATDFDERFVAAARDLDDDAVEAVLDDLFSRGSFERVTDTLLFPALRSLGSAWAAGDVGVAGEHLVSGAVQRRLALALDAAGTAGTDGPAGRPRPRVIVGLPPGCRHELGALAFAVAARRAGLAVTYLGADLPATDWVTATAAADAAVIGVVTRRDVHPAREVAAALRAAHPSLSMAFGGDAAPDDVGTIRLAPSLRASVEQLLASIRTPRSRTATDHP